MRMIEVGLMALIVLVLLYACGGSYDRKNIVVRDSSERIYRYR